MPARDAAGSSAWSVVRAAARVVGPPRADRGGDRRAQVELGERGAQVEAGAADDDRAPALREQRVDLRVGALGVGAGGERLA